MVFSSVTFLFCFLPFTVFLYYIPALFFRKNSDTSKIRLYKNIILCIASLFFYAWGEPVNVLLMLLSIGFNYVIALDMDKENTPDSTRKALLIFAVIFDIGMLGFFKYSGFIADSIFGIFGAESGFSGPVLPIGISFYTFQILSYVIDVYTRKVEVQKSLLNFALYISMFPQLIAGPIVQYSYIDSQLDVRRESLDSFSEGIYMFIKGLSKKTILANAAGSVYDTLISAGTDELSMLGSWGAIIFFAFQIYFDFSGYSDMAKGLGGMFGFRFPDNFNHPYTAVSITDFWRRWHITLSGWFRDYVYIPMGGSRCSVPRQILNLFTVWSLTGLWHGASWNFVLWGIYYFVLLVLEKFVFGRIIEKIPPVIRRVITFIFVLFGWVLFSCENMGDIGLFFAGMFGANGIYDSDSLYIIVSNIVMLAVMAVCSTTLFSLDRTPGEKKGKTAFRYICSIILFALSLMCLIGDTYNPFLYFRF